MMTLNIDFRFKAFVALIIIASLASCSNNKFKIKGEIYDGEDQTLVLEKSDFQGRWLPIDSVKTNKNGGFSLAFPAPMAPEIYRLSFNNQFIYFPVDSVETLSLTTNAEKFGRDFNLTGSRNAELITQFEKKLHKTDTSNPDSLVMFKKEVFSTYMKDFPGSIVNFYILTKTVDGKQLYDPQDAIDGKYFAAVATGFKSVRPNDPHTSLLEQTALNALKKRHEENGKYLTLEAEEIAVVDIDRPDENGENVKLSSIIGKGKPVIVIFSLLNANESPEFNIALAQLYKKYNGNVEFYNVSLDSDQYAWRDAARNLPWITVYSPGESNSEDAMRYNVFQLPAFFVYNSQGELVTRAFSLEELEKNLK